jgi:hypothetical protein
MAGVLKKNCFFTGSTSTLRTHIARYEIIRLRSCRTTNPSSNRNPDHEKLYTARCKDLNIVANHRALSKAASGSILAQGSLDGIVTRQPRPPTFSTAGLLDYIIELVVEEDEVRAHHCIQYTLITII